MREFETFIEVGAVEQPKLEKGNQFAALGKTFTPIHSSILLIALNISLVPLVWALVAASY